MNIGLIQKAAREVWGGTLAFAAGLFAFELLLGVILPAFQKEFGEMLGQFSFLQRIIAALLGTKVGTVTPATALGLLGWVHPLVLALIWAQAIVICSRFPAGEVDRGTVDVLMSLPVTRTTVFLSEAFAFVLAALFIAGTGLLGNLIGGWISGMDRPGSPRTFAWITLNLYALGLTVGGVTSLLSALCDRRGRTIGIAFGVLLVSFFLSSMSSFNALVDKLSILSLLSYYRPYQILHEGAFPFADLAVLLSISAGTWLLGWLILLRRDFRIV